MARGKGKVNKGPPKKKSSKDATKERKKRERGVIESLKGARGQKKVLNPKRHKGKHSKKKKR